MRRFAAVFMAMMLLLSASLAEEGQKAPDYVLEGYDGGVTGRNWDTNLFFARMQEKTGISFQFNQHTDEERWTERKHEIAEGDNLPDVLFKAELSGGEIRDLYEAGRIIDLSPYLEEYAPDLWKLLQEHPAWKEAITFPDGSIPALPQFNTLQNNDAMWINSQWLRRAGLEMPATAEELTEVLRAFRDKDPNGNYEKDEVPLTFIGMWELRFLAHAFGIIDNDYYLSVEDGRAVSHLTSDENRAFLTWLHELWEEGLIDQRGFAMTENVRKMTDENAPVPYGVILSYTPLTVVPVKAADQYTLLEPLTHDGEKIYRSLLGDTIRGTFAVTSACREPEKLVSWVNALYTEEGSRMAYYGLENEEYIRNEDGTWEWMMDAQTVASTTLPEATISEGGIAPGILDAAFQLEFSDAQTRTFVGQLHSLTQYSRMPFPSVILSGEDEKRIAEIQRGLSDYAETAMACFVAGDTPLTDENWEAFCRTAEEKGLTEMIGIWQKYIR